MKIFFGHGLVFNFFITIVSSFLCNLQFFTSFDNKLALQGLIISCRIVSRTNGMGINLLMAPLLAVFLINFIIFNFSKVSCSKFMVLYEPVKLLKAWNMDNLLRQWIGFEDFNILNFSNILKFAIVLNIFDVLSFFK